jgi:hypothetical protein
MTRNSWKRRLLGIIACAWLLPSLANAWTIAQDFDNQSVSDKCPWQATQSVVTNAKSASGPNACELHIKQGQTGYGVWGGELHLPNKLTRGDEIWIRVRTYWPPGFDYDSTSSGKRLKFLRVRTYNASGSATGHDDWYINPTTSPDPPFSFIYEGEGQWVHFGGPKFEIKHGVWETYEFYIKFDSTPASQGGQARIITWKDGVMMKDIGGKITLKDPNGYASLFRLFTYWNGGSPATQNMFVDDLTITSDTPGNRDANGNPYIGMGSLKLTAPPNPPTNIN